MNHASAIKPMCSFVLKHGVWTIFDIGAANVFWYLSECNLFNLVIMFLVYSSEVAFRKIRFKSKLYLGFSCSFFYQDFYWGKK